MLRLHRLDAEATPGAYVTTWKWMRQQPDLYSEVIGFYDFTDFVRHPGEQIDFALRDDGELIAFASLVLRGRKVCEFELITPPRPRVRSILALCGELQRQYFEDLGFAVVFTQYPNDPRYDRPRRLCRMFGWRESKPNYFEYTIQDHLRAINGQDQKAYSKSASAL